MKIYVIRHGETEWNLKKRLQGQEGADLDSEGILLATITADALKDVTFDRCYTSPLIRARHTAEIMMKYCLDAPIIDEPRIMEISFGEWEGKCVDPEHIEVPADIYSCLHTNPFAYVPPKGGEKIAEVVARCNNFYEELIHNPELEDKTILISTHGCAGRAFLNSVYENKEDFWHGGVPMNCAINIINVKDGVGYLTEEDVVYYPEKYYHNYYGTGKLDLK